MQNLIKQLEDLGKAYRKADFGIDSQSLERIDNRVLNALNLEPTTSFLSKPKMVLRYFLAFRGLSILIPESTRTVLRPVGVFVVILFVALSWVGSASVFEGILPGDSLYGFKLATERARISLAIAPEKKARLELDFAGRRLNEVNRISETEVTNREARLTQAVDQFRSQLQTTQNNLQNLTRSGGKRARVAQIVDRRASEYSAVLNQASTHLPGDAQEQVSEARGAAREASIAAVTVLIDTQRYGALSLDEVKAKVGEKLRDFESDLQIVAIRLNNIPGDKYPEIESAGGPTLGSLFVDVSSARKSLESAKNYYARGGYEEAMNYYREAIGRMNQLEWGVGLYERAIAGRQAPVVETEVEVGEGDK